jgi:hypothetical protein
VTSPDGGRADADRLAGTAEADRKRRRGIAAAFAAVVFVASAVPVPSAASGAAGGGGLTGALPVEVGLTAPFHFVGYAALAALVARATGSERRAVAVAVGAVTATAFGLGVEFAQAPIPWRSFSLVDAAVNAAGAVVGAVGYALGRTRSARRRGR